MNARSQKPVRATKWNFAILTYGNLAETKQCLRTLAATMDEPFSVFVVDNASTDGTQEWLKTHAAEWLHWQCNTQNRGVPGGRNDLLDFALPHLRGEDWVVFCDNDLEFAPGWLEHFRRAMGEFPNARLLGQVGHLIEVRDDRRVLLPAPHTTSLVDVLSGGFACMVRADTAVAIGPFDEKLGLFWHEDDDYCVRALQLQVEIAAVPRAGIVHHEHATGVATSGLREGGSRRNLAYLVRKWRELGFVDDGGWIRQRSGIYREPLIRTELQRRAGGSRPIGRVEFATAYRLLETLVATPDPAKAFDAAREPLPPCWSAFVQWNLEVARAGGALELIDRLLRIVEVTERIRYAALLKPMLRVPDPRAEGPAGHGVCSSVDFDDPQWLLAADELDPMHCARDPQARDRVFWEEVSLVLSLQRSGAVQPNSTVLCAGEVRPRVVDWLTARARSVVEFDPVAPPPPQSCDVVVCVRAHSANVLSLLRHCAAEGATFAFAGDVALDGVPSRNEPQPMQLEHELGPRVGAELLWPVRTAVDDALLEACADGVRNERRLPQLCAYSQRLRTSFVLLARCAKAAATASAVLTPARPATAILGIDLRTVAYADSTSRGIGHYTIHHLAAVAARAPDLHLRCYLPHDAAMPAALLLPNVSRAEVDDYRAADVDLVHVPDPMNLSIGFDSPLRTFRHELTTVTFHDLTPLRHYIAQWPPQNREAYLDRVRQIEKSATHLLCNSQFTADDVVATLHRDAATVT
ncbi:MAG: glycosyltransferase, partial [Planctomycetota bacterium]